MPKKITEEEARKRFKDFSEYTPLSVFESSKEKMKFRHEVCGAEFWLSPAKMWSCGRGCPKCSKKRVAQKLAAKNKLKFENALKVADLRLADKSFEYVNSKQVVEVLCLRCEKKWKMITGNILRGHGCKSCNNKSIDKETHFIKKLKAKAPDWELLGEYQGANVRALFRHSPCGVEYMKTPEVVLTRPNSCRFCNAKKLRLLPEKYAKSVAHKKDYELLTNYVDWNTKILVRHKKCDNQFYCLPGVFRKSDEGCPFCKNNLIAARTASTHEEFIKNLGLKAEDYEFLTEYKRAREPILVRHKECGTEFQILPDNMLRGSGCPECKKSSGEIEVYKFVQSIIPDEEVISGDRTHLQFRRELDIWVPGRKIAIEYDGLKYHTKEHFLADPQRNWTPSQAEKYHLWKTEQCEKKGIWLIHVCEDEWIEHPEIVKDKLRATFKCQMTRYYARKLELRTVNRATKDAFLDENHIQGKARGGVAIGLYDGDELLALQLFTSKGYGNWDLTRYATKLGTSVVGGFSRCLKWFERNYSPKKIRTFGDRRWCSPFGDVYKTTGFILDGVTRPDYSYVKGNKRWHKADFRKKKLEKMGVDIKEKTEEQIMSELGYERYYNCGLCRYIKTP